MKKPITFGKYLLLERINVGGMAEVFKAKTFGVEGFERLIAVKRILPSIAEDQEFITMFVDEAKISVQLTHANVAQIFDLGRVGDSYFIAMEFIHGKDMRAIFDRARKRGETVPVQMACYVAMKMCEGLDYAHNKKDAAGRDLSIVHRDVSPQNILLSYDGECKVIDFGIAKAAGKAGQTQAGILKGKFGYMSPEQVRGLPLDRRSDIFASGICLYELLTGERLFVGESDFSTLEKVRNVEIMPPSTYNRRIPEELEHIVLKALAKDVEDRYQTAMDLHDDLQSFMYTSGNFFSRKDLSSYMRKAFAEEIAKESAREEEYRRMEADFGGRPSASGLDQFDNISSAEQPRVTVAPGRTNDNLPKPPPARKTMLGGMGVPPPPPPRASMAPPTPPPAPAAAAAPPAAVRAAGPALDMEWDEEELSTQIYDKPEGSSLLPDLPSLGAMGPRVSAQGPSAPAPIQGAPSPFTGPVVVRTPTAASPAPPLMAAPMQGSPSPFAEAAREPTSVVRNSTATARSGLGAVIAVVGIAAAIVIGLGAWFVMRSQPGTISVATDPTDSVVFVDGERASTSPASPFVIADIAPGSHIVEVRRHGYSSWGAPIQVSPGQSLLLPSVALVATPGSAPPAPTPTLVDAQPALAGAGFALDTAPTGAQVWVGDRQLTQRTPVRVTDLAPGTYQIRVELADYASWGTTITLQQGQIQQLQTPTLAARNVMVDFTSTPEGADVFLVRGTERRPVGRTPVSAAVENGGGAWTVEMTRSGSVDYSAALTLPANQPRTAHNAELVARSGRSDRPDRRDPPTRTDPPIRTDPPTRTDPPPAAGGNGTLRVNSRPWSQVRIDGRVIGNTPQMSISLPAGSHRVELTNPETNGRETFSVEIRAGQTETRIVTLTSP